MSSYLLRKLGGNCIYHKMDVLVSPILYLCVFCFRFTLVQKHTVEFNQLAMANSEGSEAMLNRVMTKDNIGVAVLLELRKELIEVSCE